MTRLLIVIITAALISGGIWWIPNQGAEKNLKSSALSDLNIYLSQFNEDTLQVNRVMVDPSDKKKIIIQGLKIDHMWQDLSWQRFLSALKRPAIDHTISLPDTRMTLYHPTTGLLNFDIALQIRFDNKDRFGLSGHIKSAQPKLSLNIKLTGQGTWPTEQTPSGEFDLQIDQTNINLVNLQLNRLSGKSQIAINKNNISFKPDLNAGSLNIFGIPWQNISIKDENVILTGESFAQGQQSSSLAISFKLLESDISINAKTLGDFLQYLERYGAQLSEHQRARTYETFKDITIKLTQPKNGLWHVLTQTTPLDKIDAAITRENLTTQITETILLPH